MARPRTRTLLAVGIPLAVIALLLGAWAVDAGASSDQVVRNTTLDGREIGGMDEAQVAEVTAAVAQAYQRTPIQIRTTGQTYRTTAAELGLQVDQKATVQAALDEGRGTAAPLRPVTWLTSFVSGQEAPLRFEVDRRRMDLVLIALEGQEGRRPSEPSVVGTADTVAVKGGVSGFALDPDDVADRLVDAAEAGRDPLSIRTEPVELKPTVSDDEATELAKALEFKTSKPLQVAVGDTSVELAPAVVRGWITSKVADGTITAQVDQDKAVDNLRDQLGTLPSEKKDASITLVNGAPQITPSTAGVTCCAEDTGDRLAKAVLEGRGRAQVDLQVDEPEFTTADAEKLGIKEPVGTTVEWKGQAQVKSFTTYHAGGEARVTNIHRIADLVRGSIIKPGETFSVNEKVGRRTTDNGFVLAGAIANGQHSEEVGGGVSQFATTLFNAAFFAGLDYGEYQSHSVHFDRYPRGREATMGFPHPDLQIENKTPYGVMIWTSYTDTSLTITLYSTQNVYGEQTAQTESPQGNCTRVTTTRTRHWSDGRTADDTVYAVYRPDFGINC